MPEYRSPDISYYRIAGFDLDMFRCATWRANLSVPACAGRWREAQTARGDRADELRLCAGCPTGAAHAGERHLARAENYQTNRCPRCRRGTTRRLIGAAVCINCYNRQREWLVGRNAKNRAPIEINKRLGFHRIGVILEPNTPSAQRMVFTDIAVDRTELELRIGRLHLGEIEFCDPGRPGELPQWIPDGMAPLEVRLRKHPEKLAMLRRGEFADRAPTDISVPPPRSPPSRVARFRYGALAASCLRPMPMCFSRSLAA